MTRSMKFVTLFESWRGAIVIALVFTVCAAGAYFVDGAVIPALLNLGAAGFALRLAVYLYRSESESTTEPATSHTTVAKIRSHEESEMRTVVKPLLSANRRVGRAHDDLSRHNGI